MKKDPGYIIRNYFKKLNKNAVDIEKDFNQEAIRHFRSDVKKLRAFLRMMRLETKEPDELKFPHNFKKMYSLVGKIRDRQVFIGKIKEINKKNINKLHPKINSLKKELEDLMKNKDELLTKKDFTEIEKKLIKKSPVKVKTVLIRKFYLQKLSICKEIIDKATYSDKEFHTLRKTIKDAINILNIARDELKILLRFSCWNKIEIEKAADLSHLLGLFNDASVSLSFIKPAEIKKSDAGEKDFLLLVRKKWLAEKLKLKKEILNKIPAIKWDF